MIERILRLHGMAAYAVIFALPALEASVFLGFVFPGEIAVLLGGVLAFEGRVSLAGAMGFAIAGAIIGDSVGYAVGKRFGSRILDGPLSRFVRRDHRERAAAFLRRHGGKAVFLGRFTAALRALVPGLAGVAEIPYPTFLLWNVLGGAVWAVCFTLIGYAAGTGYRRVQHYVGRASVIVLGFVVFAVIVAVAGRWIARNPERIAAWWRRQHQRRVLRLFLWPIDVLAARFRPGEAFGLELTGGLTVIGLVGVGFGLVLRDVSRSGELVRIDRPILDALIRHSAAGLTAAMKVVSLLGAAGTVGTLAVLLAIAFALRRDRMNVLIVTLAPAGAFALTRAVEVLVRRPRPPVAALVHATGFSFPSGHATVAAAFYGALALVLSRLTRSWPAKVAIWLGAGTLVALIGFARMYLRVNYATDVVGGFALGAAWLAVVGSGVGLWNRAHGKGRPRKLDRAEDSA